MIRCAWGDGTVHGLGPVTHGRSAQAQVFDEPQEVLPVLGLDALSKSRNHPGSRSGLRLLATPPVYPESYRASFGILQRYTGKYSVSISADKMLHWPMAENRKSNWE